MRRRAIAILLFVALAGLTFVQFRLLLIGIGLEKERFDESTEAALRELGRTLDEPNALSDQLIRFFSLGENENGKAEKISHAIDSLLQSDLQKRGVAANFSFVFTDKSDTKTYLSSGNFDPAHFKFGRYSLLLGSRIISGCNCERKLHLDATNLFGYLLGELVYLIVPSVFCLLAILAGFVFLLNTLRKEERLNAIKNDFINNLTHELKTPAFSISLSSKLARESLEKGDLQKAQGFLEIMGRENEKMKTHIEKVLELASLESGRYHLQKEPTDVHQLVEAVVAEFQAQAQNRLGSIHTSLSAQHKVLDIDKAHFKNLIGNLLDNALKYTPNAPEIWVKTTEENGHFTLSVSDNGPGIDPAWRKQVFEKFFRVPGGDAAAVKGFGLGLSYVKQVAEAHGGRAELESEVGEGTTIRISLSLS
jgi:two-component system phosphate regulon sensor histidine kinase PhoR